MLSKLNEIWDECTLLFDNLHEYPMPLMISKAHRVHKFWGEHTDFLVDYSFLFVKRTVYKHGKCTTTAFGFLMHYFRLPLIHPIRQLHQIPYKWMSRLKTYMPIWGSHSTFSQPAKQLHHYPLRWSPLSLLMILEVNSAKGNSEPKCKLGCSQFASHHQWHFDTLENLDVWG